MREIAGKIDREGERMREGEREDVRERMWERESERI